MRIIVTRIGELPRVSLLNYLQTKIRVVPRDKKRSGDFFFYQAIYLGIKCLRF